MSPRSESAYGALLAQVHHAGFGDYARGGAKTLLAALSEAGHVSGTIVDLGCGSGILARLVGDAGYDAVGIDRSAAMLDLAREHAPGARLVQSSFADAEIPPCVGVAAVGECFNYAAGDDEGGRLDVLEVVARRVRAALAPGGVFLLDAAGPGRVGPEPREGRWEEGDLRVEFRAVEDAHTNTLVRSITSVRRDTGGEEERSEERHVLRLFRPEQVEQRLARAGLRVERLASYGGTALPSGWCAFLARPLPPSA